MFFTPLSIKGFLVLPYEDKQCLENAAWRLAQGDEITLHDIQHRHLLPGDFIEYVRERGGRLRTEISARSRKQDRLQAYVHEVGRHMISTLYTLPGLNKAAFAAYTTPMQQEAVMNYVHGRLQGRAVPALDKIMGPTTATILNIAKHYAKHQLAAIPTLRADAIMLADLTPQQRHLLELHIIQRETGAHFPVDFHTLDIHAHLTQVTINEYVREQLKKRRRQNRLQK